MTLEETTTHMETSYNPTPTMEGIVHIIETMGGDTNVIKKFSEFCTSSPRAGCRTDVLVTMYCVLLLARKLEQLK